MDKIMSVGCTIFLIKRVAHEEVIALGRSLRTIKSSLFLVVLSRLHWWVRIGFGARISKVFLPQVNMMGKLLLKENYECYNDVTELNCVRDFWIIETICSNKDWWLNVNVFSCGNKLTAFRVISSRLRLSSLLLLSGIIMRCGPSCTWENHVVEKKLCNQ